MPIKDFFWQRIYGDQDLRIFAEVQNASLRLPLGAFAEVRCFRLHLAQPEPERLERVAMEVT